MNTMPTVTNHALDQFSEAYIECAAWTEDYEQSDCEQDSRGNCGRDEWSYELIARMEEDCCRFFEANAHRMGDKYESAGHDFWLTRCRHGSGYWDRPEKWGEHADALTEAAREFGEFYLYHGDDGLVYGGDQ